MPKPQSPCFECKKRHVGCHSECEEYSEFTKNLAMYHSMIRTAVNSDASIKSYHVDKALRLKKKYGK